MDPDPAVPPRTFASTPRQVPIKWDDPDMPVLFANFVWGIVDDLGDIVISVGRVDPPAILAADAEERDRAVAAIENMKGQILFRFSASPERLQKMVEQILAVLKTRETWRREVLHKEQAEA
jgi:hypothetical protein